VATMEKHRSWAGPALFSYGFRPFFLFGALHAALMVALWIPWYLGFLSLPSALPPIVWHSHELLFGYVPAIVAGFLLTAVPNWTGRLPVVGWPLIGLFALWCLGRAVVAMSVHVPVWLVAGLSLAFPAALAGVIAREVVAGKNWCNLKVLAGVTILMIAQGVFHYEVWRYGRAIFGDRLALAAALSLIMLVGGRIVPSFTTNWLKQNNPGPLPTPFNRFDQVVMIIGVGALVGFAAAPLLPAAQPLIAVVLASAGVAHLLRQLRWRPERTLAEPLLTVLHVAYAFVWLGFFLAAYAFFLRESLAATGAMHAWMVGAIGLMTLAVMTRATRGHTGRALTAPVGTVVVYGLIIVAALARILAALWPEMLFWALNIAGLAWVAAFLLFAGLYGPMLTRLRVAD